jgi:hypothetical protein
VRRAAGVATALTTVALGGCGGCGGTGHAPAPSGATPKPDYALAEEAVVRLWSRALYEDEYARAAGFFAPRAIVRQSGTRVLRSRADAIAFNRSLTCRASVLSIRHEREGVLLATFNLGPGPRGGCASGGRVRVRFEIREGLIEAWRQLANVPEPAAPMASSS